MSDLADLRQNYTKAGLLESDAGADPLALFRRWLGEAIAESEAGGGGEPNAMTLATASPGGQPAARVVLLKGFDERGFVFYTNYTGQKGQEIAANPQVSLCFWWPGLERQVRVQGRAERVPEAESDAYFAVRPRGSQLGAWASAQSRPADSREALEASLAEVEARFAGAEVPRPPHWGGYCVVPSALEFWQGRPSRLHDRLRYELRGSTWHRDRLAP